jgi:hypothetical protein
MKKEDQSYLYIVLFHIAVGFLGYLFPFTAKIYGFGIYFFGFFILSKKKIKITKRLLQLLM